MYVKNRTVNNLKSLTLKEVYHYEKKSHRKDGYGAWTYRNNGFQRKHSGNGKHGHKHEHQTAHSGKD
jgi:hypothetical protein